MGKNKGSWRKFFCCAGPPETQSSTCINISESDPFKCPSEPEPELEPEQDQEEDLYVEAEVQTSHVEIPEGNRWRWSRLHKEVEQQTSVVSLPIAEIESSSEADVQIQTSFSSIPRQLEAQAQTSFLSLRCPTSFETDAQVQTSFTELPGVLEAEAQVQTSLLSLPREREAQVQTSLLSLPGEKEAQVQTSLLSLPGEKEAQVQTSLLSLPEEKEAQVQTSFISLPERKSIISLGGFAQAQAFYPELLEKIASLPMLADTQVQTSNLDMTDASLRDFQMQTSFSDYMSTKDDTSSIGTEPQSLNSPSQSSLLESSTLYPMYVDTGMQTLPVEIPPGNDWRSARLKAEAQVQTSFASVIEGITEAVLQEQPSKLELEKEGEVAGELEFPLVLKEKFLPSELTEIAIQTSDTLLREWSKLHSLWPQANAQVQTSTIELLKKLSLLSQIETMEPASRIELLKKVSSLSVSEPEVQTSSHELQRKASSWSDSGAQCQILNAELLKKRPSSAQVITTSVYESAALLSSSLPKGEAQVQMSDVELMKKLSSMSQMEAQKKSDSDLQKYSSLSLIEAEDENQETITEGKEYLITPQVMEAQIRKWYHELPEVQTSASQAPCQRESLWSPTVDSAVQTSHVEIPLGNRWRASRLQAEAEVQTVGLQLPIEKELCLQTQGITQTQTSLLELWQARDLADAQMQTSDFNVTQTKESPPPLVVDSQTQTSLFDIWKAKEKANAQMQTSIAELPQQEIKSLPMEQIDKLVQTSFFEIWKAKELANMQQKTSETDVQSVLKPSPLLQTELEIQTSLIDIWREKGKTDTQAQTSLLELLNEQPPLMSQTDAQVQASNSEIPVENSWHASPLYADIQVQTSLELEQTALESPPFSEPEETELEFPFLEPEEAKLESTSSPQMDTQVQTSLLDIWKAKELNNAQMQTSWMDLAESTEDSFLPPQMETPVRLPVPEEASSLPPAQTDTQMQTSSPEMWKTKELADAEMQTSLLCLPQTTEEIPPSLQTECSVQPAEFITAEFSPPSQTDNKVQTSQLDMCTLEEVPSGQKQSSSSDLQTVTDVCPVPSRTDVSPVPSCTDVSPVPSRTDVSPVPSRTHVSPIPSRTDVSPVPSRTRVSPVPSRTDMSPVPSRTRVSPVPSRTRVSPVPSRTDVSPVPSPTHVSPVSSCTSVSPVPSHTDVPTFPSQAGVSPVQADRVVVSVPSCTAETPAPLWTTESTVPSGTVSPMRPPTPASPYGQVNSVFPEESSALMQKSLLELWSTRGEVEVQIQTAHLGLSFEDDLHLFPKLVESQAKKTDGKKTEEKMLHQISKAEMKSNPPVFTEAQVQTSYVDIPRGKKWRSSRLCTEAQVQTSFHDLRLKDRIPTLHDHVAAKRYFTSLSQCAQDVNEMNG
ncbi:protein P200-like isoform X2 [Varanus komodoensis]|uniref:protein P200-like isoform X2 n=1 Tax=Varanus komodoensis TaxID=61221 RepID=UPI001CF78AA3|nr:protein P200-like isoform X2 [Varanus komodoensis]